MWRIASDGARVDPRSLAPYLADPDARVRLAVVKAPRVFREKGGLSQGFHGDFMGFIGDLMLI